MSRILISKFLLFLFIGITAIVDAKPPVWKIKKISFNGNSVFSGRDLLNVMDLKPKWPINNVKFTDSKLRSDIDIIEKLYRNNGYLFVNIKMDSIFRDTVKHRVSVVIGIKEGTRAVIDNVKLIQSRNILDTSLTGKMACKSGKPLYLPSIDDDDRRIKEILGAKGFLSADVDPQMSIDTLRNKTSIKYKIDEGPRIQVGSIHLKGSSGLARRVIYRELMFKSGDTLTLKQIRKSERRLYKTNLFKFVQIEPVLTDSISNVKLSELPDSSYPVSVRVSQSDFFKVQTGIGYGTYEGVRTSLLTSYNNVLHLGHKITLEGNVSNRQQKAEVNYSTPWFCGLPIQFDAKTYYKRYGFIIDKLFGKDYAPEDQNPFSGLFEGFQVSVGQELDFNFSYQLWSRWEFLQWLQAESDAEVFQDSTKIPEDFPKGNTQSIGFGITYDTRNDLLNPVRGIFNSFTTDVAGLTGVNSTRFIKFTEDLRFYWSKRNLHFGSSLKLGYAQPYGDSLDIAQGVPIQERFFGGGARSVRGFKTDCLAHYDDGKPKSGDILISANILEFRFPIYGWLCGALFIDAGYVWDRDEFLKENIGQLAHDIRWGAGPGIRLNTPLAIIRFDTGFKLDRRSKNESLYEIHFDIGQAF